METTTSKTKRTYNDNGIYLIIIWKIILTICGIGVLPFSFPYILSLWEYPIDNNFNKEYKNKKQ